MCADFKKPWAHHYSLVIQWNLAFQTRMAHKQIWAIIFQFTGKVEWKDQHEKWLQCCNFQVSVWFKGRLLLTDVTQHEQNTRRDSFFHCLTAVVTNADHQILSFDHVWVVHVVQTMIAQRRISKELPDHNGEGESWRKKSPIFFVWFSLRRDPVNTFDRLRRPFS